MKSIKAAVYFLARPNIFFYTLIWLIVLLIFGTLAQRDVGLYVAQRTYFSSFILWIGLVPLPGGRTTIGIILICLVAKLVLGSPWRWSNAGIIITHLGAMLLLLGGLLTAVHSQEGSMLIYEGASSDFISSYHDRELVVTDSLSSEKIVSFPWKDLEIGKVFEVPGLNFTIEVVKICRNCAVFQRGESPANPINPELQGRARQFDMEPTPLMKEDEPDKSVEKNIRPGKEIHSCFDTFHGNILSENNLISTRNKRHH